MQFVLGDITTIAVDAVVNAAFDLFDKLGANDEQLDFPVVYASGINGWTSMEEGEPGAAGAWVRLAKGRSRGRSRERTGFGRKV